MKKKTQILKRIEVIIATRNRIKKLNRTLISIPGAFKFEWGKNEYLVGIDTKLIADGDFETFYHFSQLKYDIEFVEMHCGSVYCRNLLIQKTEHPFIYATDDIEFLPKSIATAYETFFLNFPDGDGMVAFAQVGNRKYNPGGVALIGQKFLNRYPDRKLFYPEYFHFACQEIHMAAEKLGKFILEENAIVHHHNPNLEKHEMDQTHLDARLHKTQDHNMIAHRKSEGLIWGING